MTDTKENAELEATEVEETAKEAETTEASEATEAETTEATEAVKETEATEQTEEVKAKDKKKKDGFVPPQMEEDTLKISHLLAELVGTFLLTGAVIKLAQSGTLGALGISFSLMLLILIFGPMSGGHLNPAITIALLINRKIEGVKAVAYVIAQVIGALLALLIFHALWRAGLNTALTTAINNQGGSATLQQYGGDVAKLAAAQNMSVTELAKQLGLGFINMPIAKGGEWIALAAEVLGSAVFGLGIGHAVYADKKTMLETGFSVGFALFAGLGLAGSTAILNPAVAAAIGAFQWGGGLASLTFWAPILVYIVGTIVGMTIGITAYRYLREKALDINVF